MCLRSPRVLFVGDLLHPVDVLAVDNLGNGEMAHAGFVSGAMPVLYARRDPNDVSGLDLALRLIPFLHPAGSERDDQHLPRWMGMPSGARAGFERHVTRCHF